jgi:hypothetical protein
MRTRTACILVLLVLAAASASGQKRDDTDGVLFLNADIKFILKEPAGWVLDTQTAKSQGVEAVLYGKGSSWKNATAVMYARVIHKDETQDTIEKVISKDVADFLKLSKDSTVTDSPSIETRDKKQALVKVFYDAANKNYESVAFIDHDKVAVIIALSSRTKNEYEKALPAFRDLVASFFAFTLTIQPTKEPMYTGETNLRLDP